MAVSSGSSMEPPCFKAAYLEYHCEDTGCLQAFLIHFLETVDVTP